MVYHTKLQYIHIIFASWTWICQTNVSQIGFLHKTSISSIKPTGYDTQSSITFENN